MNQVTGTPAEVRSDWATVASAPSRRGGDKTVPLPAIEGMRWIAVVLLVTYHVVGASSSSGLQLDYAHPLRLIDEFLIDFRMPVFACISGFVYAIRPLDLQAFPKFLSGKVRRLLLPGFVAAMAFAGLSTVLGNGFGFQSNSIPDILFFPYAHYWFLQAIFLIFLGYGLLDSVLRGRFTVPLFVLSVLACLFVLPADLLAVPDPIPAVWFFSLPAAVYLLPFFLSGVILKRYTERIVSGQMLLVPLAFLILILTAASNINTYRLTGQLSADQSDFQSVGFGLSACLLLWLLMPRPQVSAKLVSTLREASFTVYLYHIVGTSGMRRVLEALLIDSLVLNLLAGLVAGIALPLAMHLVASRYNWSRRLFLGLRARD